MNICIYSKTPLAAAPWELYKALRKYTNHKISYINERNKYNDGRIFPFHLLWNSNNGTARKALDESVIWHVHNYLSPILIQHKHSQKILAQFHSLPRLGNWRELMKFADACYTIDQPLQLKEYKLKGLPNIIDPDEYRPIKRQSNIRIAFAPSSRAPVGHLMSKGYNEVKKILNLVAAKRDVEIDWIERLPYEENLKRKQNSDILIDDVVTGNWHRTSLEGLCFGCVVINRNNKVPFVYAGLETLESTLVNLIDNISNIRNLQEYARLWVLQNWHPIEKLKPYLKAYEELLIEKNRYYNSYKTSI